VADENLQFFLSGGVANTNSDNSLGGPISSTQLFGQLPVYTTTTISGVTLVESAGLPEVELYFQLAGNLLYIRIAGSSTLATEVDVSTDGNYILEITDLELSLTVAVVSASLPAGDTMVLVNATNIQHNLFDAVSSTESQFGVVNYRHFYITNVSAISRQYYLLVAVQLNGMDYIETGFENVTSGVEDTLMLDENTTPVGVSFKAVTDAVDGILLTILPGQSVGVFVRRTVVALTNISVLEDTSVLQLVEVI